MKNIFYTFLALLSLSFLGIGCSSNGSDEMDLVDVTYSIKMEPSSSKEPFILKGFYSDGKGELIPINEETPWSKTITGVPASQTLQFKGYLYCIATHTIRGKVEMTVKNKRGKVIYSNSNEMDLSNYSYGSLGYSGDEMKRETSFHFQYK